MTKIRDKSFPPSPFLSVLEAAAYLGLGRQTLDNFRWAGGGPLYRKHGGRVLYKREDLDKWSDERAYEHTGQATPKTRH